MGSFKVGDRVEYASKSSSVITTGDSATVVNIDRDGRYQIVMDNPSQHAELLGRSWSPVDFHWTVNATDLRPAAPRKGIPAVGDTVRVVLEGAVFWLDEDEFDMGTQGGGGARNVIVPGSSHVKSIEILKPAKPSVKDLPVGSAVRTPGLIVDSVFVKLSSESWISAASGLHYDQASVDEMDWTLLVPQESE